MLQWLDVLPFLSAESDIVHALLQIGQLLALEYLVGVALPDKTRQTAVALKALYDEDVVDEVCSPAAQQRPCKSCATRQRPAAGRQPRVDAHATWLLLH